MTEKGQRRRDKGPTAPSRRSEPVASGRLVPGDEDCAIVLTATWGTLPRAWPPPPTLRGSVGAVLIMTSSHKCGWRSTWLA